MMGVTGLEPDTGKNANLSNGGHNQLSSDHNKSQVTVGESHAKVRNVNMGTEYVKNQPHAGQGKNITAAEREHNMSRIGLPSDTDLMKVVATWKKLPEAIRNGILAMVDAAIKKQLGD